MSNSLKKCSLQQPSDPTHKDAKGDNFIQATLGKLRQTSPTLAKAATFAATTGTIAANSSLLSVPLWGMGLVKTFTGNSLADKAVLKLSDHWIHTNNQLIDKVQLPSPQ